MKTVIPGQPRQRLNPESIAGRQGSWIPARARANEKNAGEAGGLAWPE